MRGNFRLLFGILRSKISKTIYGCVCGEDIQSAGHEYSSSCRFCLKNVASNHSVGLFTIQAIGQDLSGRLSKLLLVPVAQSDGLSQSICRTWRIADICSSLSVKRPSPTLCSASVSPWSKLETHSATICGSVHVM